MIHLTRRTFLGGALGGAALTALPQLSAYAGAIVSAPLNEQLFLLTGSGANVLAMRGREGALLVDGGLADNSSALLQAALQATGARRVHTLFNTHWHPEHTGSNERLGKSGARIIAHENTKLWLGHKIVVSWRVGSYGRFAKQALPNQTFYENGKLDWDGETIEYGYLTQAHTDGDLYVRFAKANVLVAGGVIGSDAWPLLDYETGGWIAGMIGGVDKLLALSDANTRIAPANGPLLTRADMQAQRDAYRVIYEGVVKSLRSGLGPDEAVAAQPAKGLLPAWGNPDRFVEQAFKSLWGHFAPDA